MTCEYKPLLVCVCVCVYIYIYITTQNIYLTFSLPLSSSYVCVSVFLWVLLPVFLFVSSPGCPGLPLSVLFSAGVNHNLCV